MTYYAVWLVERIQQFHPEGTLSGTMAQGRHKTLTALRQHRIVVNSDESLRRCAPPYFLRWLRLRLAPALPDTRSLLAGAWKTVAAAAAGSLPVAAAEAARCAFLAARLDVVLRPHSRMAVTLRPRQPL